jgi:hypothetical protein
MNYLNAIASAVFDPLIVRKIFDAATFSTNLSAFNEKNVVGVMLVDPFQKRYVFGTEETSTNKSSLSAFNEKDIRTIATIDSAQKRNVMSMNDPITFRTGLSAFNFPIPSLTDELYKKQEEYADTDWMLIGTNTEVESVSSLYNGIATVPKDNVSNAFLIVKATNTEVESLSSLFNDVTAVPKDDVSNTFLIVKATNTEVESLSSLYKDVTAIPKDNVSNTFLIVKATNTEVESLSSLFNDVTAVPKDNVSNAFLIVKATNTEVESLSSLFNDVTAVPKDSANNAFLIVKATNTEVESLSSLFNDVTTIPKDNVSNTFLIVKATNTEVESLSSLFNDVTTIPKDAASTFDSISGYNADYYHLSSVFKGIPGEIASTLTETGTLFGCTTGYNSDYYHLSSVFKGIPGEIASTLTETGSQFMSVTALNFNFNVFEDFEPNSDVTVDDALATENLSAINSAASNFLIVSNRYTDTDASAYLNLVEAADSQPLEIGIKNSIHEFVLSCKQSGLWGSINNCFIFSGAKTLSGALVPLKGNSVSFHNFASGRYNRKRIQGNGTSYITLGGASSTLNNFHAASHKITSTGSSEYYFGDAISTTIPTINMRSEGSTKQKTTTLYTPTGGSAGERVGFHAINRNANGSYDIRYNRTSFTAAHAANPAYTSQTLTLFKVGSNTPSTVGLSFFSIGTSLDFALYEQIVGRLVYHTQSYST